MGLLDTLKSMWSRTEATVDKHTDKDDSHVHEAESKVDEVKEAVDDKDGNT